jgi:PAS domain S-box-containing protein
MAELSTLVTSWILEWLEGHSISGADWSAGICEPEDLIEPDGFIAWESFTQLCERLAEFSEERSDDGPRIPAPGVIGREIAEEIFSSAATRIDAEDVPFEILFVDDAPIVASELFPEIEVRADIASDGEVVLLDVGLPADAIDCPVFFELIHGVLEAAPLLVDQEPADVALEIHPEHARYAIRIPRDFDNVIPLETGIGEAREETREEAHEAHKEDQAQLQLDDPCEQGIEREEEVVFDHRAFIHSLSACASASEISDHLFALVRERFRCAASRVSLEASATTTPSMLDEHALIRFSSGKSDKPPSRSLRLGVAGEVLGQIDLWDEDPMTEEELGEFESLIPWYALAFRGLRESKERESEEPAATPSQSPSRHPALEDQSRTSDLAVTLENVVAGRANENEDFLVTLVRSLAGHIEAHTAVISLCHPEEPQRLRTVAAWKGGAVAGNFSYDVEGTPCANVLAGEPGCHPTDVQQQFPADASLVERQTQSYLGMALHDPEGRIVGIFSAWSRQPLARPEDASSLIRILAHGAETELQNRSDREARQISEARNRGLIESAHDLIAELSATSGLLEISPNLTAILGYSPEAFVEIPYRDLIHAEDLVAVTECFREAQRSQTTVSATFRIRHRDGSWCLLETRARSYPARDGELRVVVAARDVRERAGAEQERAQLVSIIQNSSDLIALMTLNGKLLFLNASGQRLLGLASEEEARTQSVYDFVHDNVTQSVKFDIMPMVHRRKHWSGELDLRQLKTQLSISTIASLFVIDDHRTGQPRAIAMICRDISDRKESEVALLESEERYRMLAENPFDLIVELDENAHFIYVSPNFETALGYSPESLLGSPAVELAHPDDRAQVAKNFTTAVENLGTIQTTYRARHKDGSDRWLETTTRAYRTAGSKLMCVLISRDITNRVKADEALRQTEQKLQQSQKMEAIGRMAGGVAHDFNNLLTAIMGYSDLLLEELDGEDPSRTNAEEILKASERAAGLTQQLLAFSRRQVLQPRVLDLNSLVADMDRMLRRLIGEDVEFVSILDGAAWPIKADPGQLQQVLLNLAVNARDAMPRGGRITIETANASLEEPIQTELEEIPAGDYLTLSVRDTGTGMTPDDDLRTLLYHQGERRGHRAGAQHGDRHRPTKRRQHRGRERARSRLVFRGLLAEGRRGRDAARAARLCQTFSRQ